MSLNIHCPRCNEIYGKASFASGLKEVYDHVDSYGHPVCDTCGYNLNNNPSHRHLLFVLAVILGMITLGTLIGIYWS